MTLTEHRGGRALRLGVATAAAQRMVGALIPLVSVPLALHQLGDVGYGAWAVTVSATTLFAFADLGIGTGLMSRLGARTSEGRFTDEAQLYVSTAYAIVGALAGVMLATLLVMAAVSDLAAMVGAPHAPHVEAIVLITLSAFLVNVVVGLIVRVQYAVGWQVAANLWQMAGSILMLAGMGLAALLTTGPNWFVTAAAFVPVAAGLLNSAWFYGGSHRGRRLRPAWSAVSRATASALLGIGLRFLLVSLLLACATALDPLVVAHTAKLGEVAGYAIPARIFSIVGLVSVMALMPVWPLHARAVAEGDTAWIRHITRRLTFLCTAVVVSAVIVVVLASQLLVRYWLDGGIEVNYLLWIGLGAYCVAQTFAGPMFMLQNGAEILAPQLVGYLALSVTLPIKWLVSADISYVYLPWIGVAAYVCFVLPACVVGYRKSLRLAAIGS